MCGGVFPHQGKCPALGKQYSNCQKLNHFAKVCRSATKSRTERQRMGQAAKAIQQPDVIPDMDDDDEPEGPVYVIHATEPGSQVRKRVPKCKVKVARQQVTALIDTGASINILAQSVFNQLRQPPPPLRCTAVQVFAFGSTTPLPLAGVFTTNINHEEITAQAKVYVAKIGTGMLLSCRRAEEFKLVTFAFSIHIGTLDNLQEEYTDLFRGIGYLKGRQVRLHFDTSIEPEALKHRSYQRSRG
ncbi:hypothetical protein NDU88_009531 [Pleurodeles waltl]|uniref:Retropepsins domain-containing protein n=1 Tax=Pleurodeles waltl TaxID=8319 RepID=A0AAV7QT88_PLEWA|nr:hypothetical protein NDU88_009531 [Pleurodeles waltl]